MDKLYSLAMGFTGCVLIAVVILFSGGFKAMGIPAPVVFAALGTVALVAFLSGNFIIFRERVYNNTPYGSIKAVAATIVVTLVLAGMMWLVSGLFHWLIVG